MPNTTHKTTAEGHPTAVIASFCENLALAWTYKVLAITETHVLVFLTDDFKKEYVSYAHDNKGNCHSGLYTKDRTKAVDDFVKRMRVYL